MTKETTVKEILGNQYDLCVRLEAIDQTTLDLERLGDPDEIAEYEDSRIDWNHYWRVTELMEQGLINPDNND